MKIKESSCFAHPGPPGALFRRYRSPPIPAPEPRQNQKWRPKSGVLLDRVIAVVNEGIITQGELEEHRYHQGPARINTQPPADSVLRTQILERLVVQQLQLQKADRSSLKVSMRT